MVRHDLDILGGTLPQMCSVSAISTAPFMRSLQASIAMYVVNYEPSVDVVSGWRR